MQHHLEVQEKPPMEDDTLPPSPQTPEVAPVTPAPEDEVKVEAKGAMPDAPSPPGPSDPPSMEQDKENTGDIGHTTAGLERLSIQSAGSGSHRGKAKGLSKLPAPKAALPRPTKRLPAPARPSTLGGGVLIFRGGGDNVRSTAYEVQS
jgi:hypothetical protein